MVISKRLKMVRKFHKNKKSISKIIKKRINRDEVVFGAQAHNKQLPRELRVHTEDYDILTNNPKKEAKEAERALDRKFGGNYFETKAAIHAGTYKVKSRINGKGYADYSKPDKKVPFKKIGGKKYVKLSYVKKTIKKTLKDPTAAFRHAKDKDTLNRIRIAEKMRKTKKRTRSQPSNGLVFRPSRFKFKPL